MKRNRGLRDKAGAAGPEAAPPPTQPALPAPTEESFAPTPSALGKRFARLLREVATGLLFAALILGAKLLIEQTSFGHQLEAAAYNLLQLRLASSGERMRLLDISELRPAPFEMDGQVGFATPREPLRQMIEALVEKKETRPKAIGIDLDFSPDGAEYITPRDPDFYQFCLDASARTGVPIYLGVERTNTRPPEDWLGGEEYQALAADLSIPNDRRKILRWVRAGEGARPLVSMGAALADAYAGRSADEAPGWWRGLHTALVGRLERAHMVESVSEKRLAPGLEVGEFLVDFSPLERLKETRLRTINPVVVRDQAHQFKDRVVLVGDATPDKAEDPFPVPAREEYFPGIYLHAAAAHTLIEAPLYEVTHAGRVVIDVLLSAAVILGVALVGFYFSGRSKRRVASHRVQGLLIILVVALALVLGVVFVRETRLIWTDFILALGMLAMHPSIERRLHAAWGGLRRGAPAAVERVVYESEGGRGHE